MGMMREKQGVARTSGCVTAIVTNCPYSTFFKGCPSKDLFIVPPTYITRGRSLRDLHTRGPQALGNVNHRRDRLPSDVTNLYHGKSIEHLTRFEDRNNVWPKLMVSYKFMLK